uniref:Integron gene cassette protein n=1 Tax=Macrostomum lignano TaxID=282301 RepID=A0A1I8FH78_9PLAT
DNRSNAAQSGWQPAKLQFGGRSTWPGWLCFTRAINRLSSCRLLESDACRIGQLGTEICLLMAAARSVADWPLKWPTALATQCRPHPSAYQFRYAGAKGVLSGRRSRRGSRVSGGWI